MASEKRRDGSEKSANLIATQVVQGLVHIPLLSVCHLCVCHVKHKCAIHQSKWSKTA